MSITLILIIVTGLISYKAFNDPVFASKTAHYPYEEKRNKSYYRWLTSGFVHGDWTHLLINLFVFYSFGESIENVFTAKFGPLWGRLGFLLLYFGSMLIADMFTYFKHQDNPSFRSVGASGAISGVVFAFVLFSPLSMLLVMFIIPMPAILFAVLYVAYSFYASRTGMHAMFDHDAHLWGGLAGLIITIILIPESLKIFWGQLSGIFG